MTDQGFRFFQPIVSHYYLDFFRSSPLRLQELFAETDCDRSGMSMTQMNFRATCFRFELFGLRKSYALGGHYPLGRLQIEGLR